MINSKIKDQIILLLSEGKGTAVISQKLQIDQSYAVALIKEIESEYPGCFMMFQGYENDYIGVSLSPQFKEQIVGFAKRGGFEEKYKKQAESQQKEAQKLDLEIEELKSAKLNAQIAAKEARSSRWAAWIAAVAAVVIILWDILKSFLPLGN